MDDSTENKDKQSWLTNSRILSVADRERITKVAGKGQEREIGIQLQQCNAMNEVYYHPATGTQAVHQVRHLPTLERVKKSYLSPSPVLKRLGTAAKRRSGGRWPRREARKGRGGDNRGTRGGGGGGGTRGRSKKGEKSGGREDKSKEGITRAKIQTSEEAEADRRLRIGAKESTGRRLVIGERGRPAGSLGLRKDDREERVGKPVRFQTESRSLVRSRPLSVLPRPSNTEGDAAFACRRSRYTCGGNHSPAGSSSSRFDDDRLEAGTATGADVATRSRSGSLGNVWAVAVTTCASLRTRESPPASWSTERLELSPLVRRSWLRPSPLSPWQADQTSASERSSRPAPPLPLPEWEVSGAKPLPMNVSPVVYSFPGRQHASKNPSGESHGGRRRCSAICRPTLLPRSGRDSL
ncbi:hypothetical protein C4D60_Mb06t01820 [Musa balbisiana]|uniref:Uncharacterized protein n=1 Tax=Musa balbisiana TaxID=52838 RepID=A0A4S8IL84_MUSBA|nr:hypothetical protein C4D60_Mb06t01820 [Musa balbisiana]